MRKDLEHPDLPPVTEGDMQFVRNVFRSIQLNPSDDTFETFMVGRKAYEAGVRPKDLV